MSSLKPDHVKRIVNINLGIVGSSEDNLPYNRSKLSKSFSISYVHVTELSYSNVYIRSSSNLPHFIKIFLNFSYYLLLSPFRVVFDENSYKHRIHTYTPHTIICGFLHPIYFLYSTLLIRGCLTSKIVDEPSLIFKFANYSAWSVYIFLYLYIFWFKKKHILSLFTIPERPLTTKVRYLTIFLCCMGICVTIYDNITRSFLDADLQWKNMESWFSEYTNSYLHVWLARDITNSSLVQLNDFTPGLYVFGVINYILSVIWNLYLNYFEILGFILTLSGYQAVMDSYLVFFPKDTPKFNLKVLLQHYSAVKDLISKINRVGNCVILGIFVQIMTWVSETGAEVLDKETWTLISLSIYYYTFYMLVFGMAAETLYKMRQFEFIVLEHLYRDYLEKNSFENFTAFLKTGEETAGIKGGRFFKISYGFLGSVIAALITYAIIMVQLEGPEY